MNDHEAWIKEHLWYDGIFSPEMLGDQQVLFSAKFDGPLALLFLKGFDADRHWKVRGITADSLFAVLAKIAETEEVFVFGIVNPDDAISEFSGGGVAEPRFPGTWNLRAFEQQVEENGARWQCYGILEKRWILAFHRSQGFSVQCFGSKEITTQFIKSCSEWSK